MIISRQAVATCYAIGAAGLFGISAPVAKILLEQIPPMFLAALLYLGAGGGMAAFYALRFFQRKQSREARLGRGELYFTTGMILLDIAAPILLMFGLTMTSAANASLLNNFEIVATSLVALVVFKEAVGQRLWIAIALITLASIVLTVDGFQSLSFSMGSFLVLGACLCWGLENNLTRMMALKDPMQIVIVKGLGSGTGALILAFFSESLTASLGYIMVALVLGFFAYGVSIFLYVLAQRELGAARTSTFYAIAPFIGVGASILFLHEGVTANFLVGSVLMIAGAYYAAFEHHAHSHVHRLLQHEHRHRHDDGHHQHAHDEECIGEHSHNHIHEPTEHIHRHTPDLHHSHEH